MSDINSIIAKRRAKVTLLKERIEIWKAHKPKSDTHDLEYQLSQEEKLVAELVDVACHKMTGKELAEAMSDFVNSFGSKSPEFIEGFTRQHRTLQQSMMRLMLQTIEAIASPDYSFDARNESSHETAKKLMEGFKLVEAENFKAQRGGVLTEYDRKYIESDNFVPSGYMSSI
jgi:hypothetical protein